jgi:hypothetical protein
MSVGCGYSIYNLGVIKPSGCYINIIKFILILHGDRYTAPGLNLISARCDVEESRVYVTHIA